MKRALIIGATGFMGARLAEVLSLNTKVKVRAMVRNFTTASRLARLDIELVRGDVTSQEDVMRGAESCDVIFNCAKGGGDKGSQKKVNIGGVRNIITAAARLGASRVVHVSTVAVYGLVPDGDIDETAPCHPKHSDIYGSTKLKGEQEALKLGLEMGVEVAVIRPTMVYGPWSAPYTLTPLNLMSKGMVLLPRGGICNAVYIDDVIKALLLAAQHKDAAGESFIISGEPVTWQEFFHAYEKMLGGNKIIEKDFEECLKMRHTLIKDIRLSIYQSLNAVRETPSLIISILEIPEVRSLLRRFVMPLYNAIPPRLKRLMLSRGKERAFSIGESAFQGKIYLASLDEIKFYASKSVFRIDKARQLLGYRPDYDLSQGMAITEKWARWANLI